MFLLAPHMDIDVVRPYKALEPRVNEKDSGIRLTSLPLSEEVGRCGAMLAQQIHFKLLKAATFEKEGRRWHFISEKQLCQELGYSIRSIRRAIKALIDKGLLIVKRFVDIMCARINCYTLVLNDEDPPPCDQRYARSVRNLIVALKDKCHLFASTARIACGRNTTAAKMAAIINNKDNSLYRYKTEETNNEKNSLGKILERMGLGKNSSSIKESTESTNDGSVMPTFDRWVPDSFNQAERKEGDTMGDVRQLPTFSEDVAREMVEIYNDEFIAHKRGATPIPLRNALRLYTADLGGAWRHSLRHDMEVWRHVCRACRASSWMRSDAFKMSLGWLLKHDTLDKVMSNEWGCRYDGPSSKEKRQKEKEARRSIETVKEIEEVNYSPIEKEIRKQLVDKVGAAVYSSWFRNATIRNGMLYATNNFTHDYIQNNFGNVLADMGLTLADKGVVAPNNNSYNNSVR